MHIKNAYTRPASAEYTYTYYLQLPPSWNLPGSICASSGGTSTLLMMCGDSRGWVKMMLTRHLKKKQVQRHSSLFFFSLDCICLDSLDLKSLQQPSILSISCLYLKMPWGYGLCLSQLTLQEKGTGVLYMALGEAQVIAP